MRARAAFLMAVLGSILLVGVLHATTLAPDRLPPRDFAAYLLDRDVVFLGHVSAVRAGASGPETTRLAVDEVLLGILPDSLAKEILVPGVHSFDRNGRAIDVEPHARVIGWGSFIRPGHVSTNLALVLPDGSVALPPGFMPTRDFEALATPAGYRGVREQLDSARTRHSLEVFAHARAAALVTLGERPTSATTWEIASLQILVGSTDAAPRRIHFTSMGYCTYIPRPGDSLLVPVGIEAQADSITFLSCPSGLVIQRGRVRILGNLPFDRVRERLKPSGDWLAIVR